MPAPAANPCAAGTPLSGDGMTRSASAGASRASRAAVELIDRLETEHELWVLPTRDPIGLNGFRYALGQSLGKEPPLRTLDDLEAVLPRGGRHLGPERLPDRVQEAGLRDRCQRFTVRVDSPRAIALPASAGDQPGVFFCGYTAP
jgi:hypothetical protein